MSDIYIFNNKIESVFQLIGTNENDISYSVGWALANSHEFLHLFLKRLGIKTDFDPNKIKIRLQQHEKKGGFTDFEIIQEAEFFLIVEAKKGWNYPSEQQISKYINRPGFMSSKAKIKRVIIFNESTPGYTEANFACESILGIPIEVISWRELHTFASWSIKKGKDAENRILRELSKYLSNIITMQKFDSNWVYVVSLGHSKPEKWDINWTDIVTLKKMYFHPVGGGRGGWPTEPPNYIAFRFNGKLQSIHHIDKYEVFTNPNVIISEIPAGKWEPHYLYHLGKAIYPATEVISGAKIVRSMRVWAMLDLLLTCTTIQDARDKSNEREKPVN